MELQWIKEVFTCIKSILRIAWWPEEISGVVSNSQLLADIVNELHYYP